MKNLFLFSIIFLCSISIKAQTLDNSSEQPQKLDDVIKAYKNSSTVNAGEDEEEMDEGRERSEGKNYQFERWVWYWRQHLDENGYMVSPLKTVEEWNNYKAKHNALNKTTVTNESQWTFTGPSQSSGGYNGIGRINVIAFHPTDPNTFIVGSGGGGAWRTTDGGVNWTPLYNDILALGVSDIDYNPLNPNTIYVCTGDRDPGGPLVTYNYSIGIYKSTDGGATWNPTGLQYNSNNSRKTNALLINPLDTNSLMVATSLGVLKSFNGGATWSQVSNGQYKEIVYCPSDTNIVYATATNGISYNIFRSSNGGATWQQVTGFGSSTRISLAVTAQNPAIVKAIAANTSGGLQGIYSSSDTGKTFSYLYGGACNTNILSSSFNLNNNTCSGQGDYDLCIAIDPTDSNKVVIGGVNTYISSNGGSSWTRVTQWYNNSPGIKTIHADKHYLAYNPIDPTSMYECNDGGVYKTSNPASTLWTDLTNGMGITMFYRLSVADAANFVIGGAQDNGSKKVSFTGTSSELTGGDGMDCQIDYDNPSIFYTSGQYGSISITTNGGNNFTNISNNIPGQPAGNWTSPILINPTNSSEILVGLDHLYISSDHGNSWSDLTPSLSNVLMNRIAMSPSDPNMIYIQFGTTSFRYSPDFGATWLTPSIGYSGSISDIKVDPHDKNSLWITYSGYTTAKVANFILGTGWSAKNDSLPNIPIQCIVIDSSNGTKYIGTDVGVFYRDSTMKGWALYNNGLPTVQVTDLEINYATNEVWAATFGRGIWKSPRHVVIPNGISNIPYAIDVVSVAPNPNKGSFKILTTNQSLVGQKVTVDLISFSGSKVLSVEGMFDSNGQLEINAENLARGTYIVDINKGNLIFARTKMVVL